MMRTYIPIGLVLASTLGVFGNSYATAQTARESITVATWPTNDWSFWPDNDDQAPKRTVSGASRDSCSNHQTTALVPTSQYGLTSKSYPEVLVATTANTPRQALFTVQSEDSYYYETYLELPETPGIVSISLPEDAPALAANELYQWSLIMMCNDQLRPDSPSMHGWIQLQSEDPAITADVSMEQAVAYRNNYLWYDMIAMLADLKRQRPNDQSVHEAWQSILAGANLTSVANTPVLE
ncbi:DUF928 domain-containing protein [Leptothoe kymatousa]|uniref:DUF928 domain-containing protein n=1 Tax=Leptothoe kymatousa TAU-MAC 1615 TaxID=2364775 RepID=A0ABS5Y6S1_9CYAN|nr:DUF928 domain-containing protein [Leptothoe kymatousa]MBT9313523.1 DUF928 domain-containing protein [Leptothoe kymatousa TAU-MAC 1615]